MGRREGGPCGGGHGDHEDHYREHHRATDSELDYETAQVGYGVGHLAGRNPDYQGRSFEEVEPEIRRGWDGSDHDYERMRAHVREGYEHTSRGDPLA